MGAGGEFVRKGVERILRQLRVVREEAWVKRPDPKDSVWVAVTRATTLGHSWLKTRWLKH